MTQVWEPEVAYSRYEEMLADPKVEAVIIIVISSMSLPQLKQLLLASTSLSKNPWRKCRGMCRSAQSKTECSGSGLSGWLDEAVRSRRSVCTPLY